MSLALKIINPLSYEGWDELLNSTQDHAFFLSQSWAKILHSSYGYEPRYFVLIDEGKLLVLFPMMEISSFLTGRRAVSLPSSDYCEPLISKNIQFEEVYDFVLEKGRKFGWETIEIRGGKNLPQAATPFAGSYMHSVNLSNTEEKIFSSFQSSTKRNIKKALREGVKITIGHTLKSVKEFYRLYSITKKRQGLPIEPFYFFNNIYKHVISERKGKVALAFYKKKCVAGAIYFHFGQKVIFKYGASNKKYQHLRPNNLLMWEAIKWFSERGFKSLSLGITDLDNNGLRRYKLGMGGKEQRVNYYMYDLQNDCYIQNQATKKSRFRSIVFKRTPIAILRLYGFLLCRHKDYG